MRRPPVHVELSAGGDVITDLAEWAEARAAELGADAERVMMARLCVEEAVTNIVCYGYDDDPDGHAICVEIHRDDEGMRLVIVDDGGPFDPTALPDSGTERTILDASIGGRGIRLMRRLSRTMSYERCGNRNRLTITL